MGAMADLQAAGKIRHAGVSNFNAEQMKRAQRLLPIIPCSRRIRFWRAKWRTPLYRSLARMESE